MTWTYDGTPGTGSAAERRDAVRFFVGDTDNTDQLVTDEEIAFALSEKSDNVRRAAADVARALEAKFASLADVSFDGVRSSYSNISMAYSRLARRLDAQAKRAGGLGRPVATGISRDDMRTYEDDPDRITPRFRRGQFENPPNDDPETRADYHR